MPRYTAAAVATLGLVLMTGCASAPENESVLKKNDAIDDYIKVAELKEIDAIKSHEQLNSEIITEKYLIISDRRSAYVLEFKRRCRELYDTEVTADIRRERNVLRARFDTYRGCAIRSLYEVTKGQADELIALGKMSGQ